MSGKRDWRDGPCCYLCERATGKRDPYDRAAAKREWQKEVDDA